MKKIIQVLMYTVIMCILILLTGACNGKQRGQVDRENLFKLEIGHLEDQIALYRLEGGRGIKNTSFTMRDGLFYISDGISGKIVRFNSYGDLILMIYNEETNPPPFTLKPDISDDEQATRWAYKYPLEEPGWITVDSRKHIFAEDRLPAQTHRRDSESGAILDGIILHFDQNGRFVNYLGREGIGGSPFPRIIGLQTSVRDELAVICRIPDGWNIYWFNSLGALLYLFKIDASMIRPLPYWPEALGSADCVFSSVDSRQIFLKVDYSRDTYDMSTNMRTGSEPVCSVIWTISVESGEYINSLEILPFEIIEKGRQTNAKVFYSMLGVTHEEKVLLSFPVDDGYSLLFADTQTKQQRRGSINFSNDELVYNDFYLSQEGILCAMLADEYNIKLVWWRTEKFIGDIQ